MTEILLYLREFHFGSAVFRLLLALLSGGIIGYGRSRKQRSAGLRTYMLVSLGAALTVLISFYEYDMLYGQWAWAQQFAELKFDGTRFSANVVSGIGFLAAGTIIGVAHQQVSGLTTAIGLFAAAGLGLAAGAGFYECVIIVSILIVVAMETLQPAEIGYKRRLRNTTVFVEYGADGDIGDITDMVAAQGAQIFDIDFERPGEQAHPAAILTLKLARRKASHSAMLSSLAELPCVYSVQELIS